MTAEHGSVRWVVGDPKAHPNASWVSGEPGEMLAAAQAVVRWRNTQLGQGLLDLHHMVPVVVVLDETAALLTPQAQVNAACGPRVSVVKRRERRAAS